MSIEINTEIINKRLESKEIQTLEALIPYFMDPSFLISCRDFFLRDGSLSKKQADKVIETFNNLKIDCSDLNYYISSQTSESNKSRHLLKKVII